MRGLARRVLLTTLVAAIGCRGLSREQSQRATAAVSSLQKLKAATQVSVNHEQYGALLIEAKAECNAASASLPAENPLRKCIESAMDAYTDAGAVWNGKLSDNYFAGFLADPKLNAAFYVVEKYSVPVNKTKGPWPFADDAMALIWARANAQTDNAALLLKQKA